MALLAVRLPRYAELNDYLREYVSAGATLPRDAVLLPLSFAPEGRSAVHTASSTRLPGSPPSGASSTC